MVRSHKYLSIILISLFIVSLVGGIFCLKQKSIPPFKLNKRKVIIEYGKQYTPSFKELVKTKGLKQKEMIYLKKHMRINNNFKYENHKSYLAVGHYTIFLEYDGKKEKVEIVVQDTTKPALIIDAPIEVQEGIDLNHLDFNQYIRANDLSQLKPLHIDYHQVNVYQSGKYTAIASIEDIYKNKEKQEFEIIVHPVEKNEPQKSKTKTDQESSKSKQTNTNQTKEKIPIINDLIEDDTKDKPWMITWWAKCKDCGVYVEEVKDRTQGWQEENIKQKLLNLNECSQNSYIDQNGIYCPGKHNIRWGANHLPEDW